MADSRRFCVFYVLPISASSRNSRNFGTDLGKNDGFSGENAYEVLGVAESSTFAEIKASFRRLAKETHPDTAGAHVDPAAVSCRFVQIVAAYEILSDFQRRAHYDQYLLSQRKNIQKQPGVRLDMYRYDTCIKGTKQFEVVEWLKWYRFAINDIVSNKKIAVGSGYLEILESEFYSAINAAYYGPLIESIDFLPDCFEAEERSSCDTPEVLHLVSGRDVLGIVSLVDKVPKISEFFSTKLPSFSLKHESLIMSSSSSDEHVEDSHTVDAYYKDHDSDVYRNLILHIAGKVVAFATRIPPKSCHNGIKNGDEHDHIHVFLSLVEDNLSGNNAFFGSKIRSRILLGTITGLGTSSEEGSCDVYDNCGIKTHVIMKHRTLMVKHLHWYQAGDEKSPCECRCSRAHLPPSKFWLFEPRCGLHDIGGWYIETFGRDKKGKTIPSQRQWDGLSASVQPDRRLHPAMYLLGLAYRTLDVEDTKRRKRSIMDVVQPKWVSILRWCKKLT